MFVFGSLQVASRLSQVFHHLNATQNGHSVHFPFQTDVLTYCVLFSLESVRLYKTGLKFKPVLTLSKQAEQP